MSHSKPLEAGKEYHFNIIYNHEDSPLDATADNKKSLTYTEITVRKLTSAGFDKSYFHKRDSRPGRNIFTELFRVINGSSFTIVILTPGFLNNQWGKYSRLSAFKKLLDQEKDHRLKALCFGLCKEQVPEELCSHIVLHFVDDSEIDDSAWIKLIQEMSRPEEPVTHPPVNVAGDNRLHTDRNALIAHPEEQPSLSSLSINDLEMDGGPGQRRTPSNPVSGVTRETESLQTDGDRTDSTRTNPVAAQGAAAQKPLAARERELATKELKANGPVTLDINTRPPPSPSTQTSMSLVASPIVSSPGITKRLPLPAQVRQDVTINDGKPAGNSAKIEASTVNVRTEQDLSLSEDTDLTYDNFSMLHSRNEEATNAVTVDTAPPNKTSVNLHAQTKEIVTNGSHDDLENTAFETLRLNSLQEETVPKELIDSGYSTEKASPEKIAPPVQADSLAVEADMSIQISSRYLSRYSNSDNESGIGSSTDTSRNSNDMYDLKENPLNQKEVNPVDLEGVQESEIIVKENIVKSEASMNSSAITGDDSTTELKKIVSNNTESEVRREQKNESATELKRVDVSDNNNENEQSELRMGQNDVAIASELKKPAVCDDNSDKGKGRDLEETDVVESEGCRRSEPDGQDAETLPTENQAEAVRGEHSATYNWLFFGFKCVSSAYTRTDSLI